MTLLYLRKSRNSIKSTYLYIEVCLRRYQSYQYQKILSHTPTILKFSSHILNSSVAGTNTSLCTPSRYPIYLLKMNNTRLPCLTATAGTRFGRDL
jgi:hypothetical protein